MKTKLAISTVVMLTTFSADNPAHAYSQMLCSLGYGVAVCGARSVNPSAKIIQVIPPRPCKRVCVVSKSGRPAT